ncbi:MAG TPA: carboxypeptidase-like regulatory domain-containing protein, partial [Pyrinomonadaceae bacterium]|nr:carboxypeptidase-like regulatory domain-containing protein [Pyrinomonadaceae bacterium]
MRKAFKFSAPLVAIAVMLMTIASSAYGKGPRGLATVSGTVRDNRGLPLSGVLIQIIREGAKKVVKEARTAADGSFSAKIPAGRYSLKAVAAGFSEVLFSSVTVTPSAEIAYRFNLEPLGAGRTYPEQRSDRDSAKWRLRSAQAQRSIFQANEGTDTTVAAVESEAATDDEVSVVNAAADESDKSNTRPQGVVEAYFAGSNPLGSSYQGLNFAVALPASESIDFIFAGQTGTGAAPQRFQAAARVRLNDRHRLGVTAGGAKVQTFGAMADKFAQGNLGQMSVRAVDEWIVRDGFVVVLGMDYSRFFGAGNEASFTPRLAVQFDATARTTVKVSYANVADSGDVQSVATFESGNAVFKRPTTQPVAYVGGRAVMARSRRFEIGLERELSNRSNVEATAFVDMTSGRGVGLLAMPASAFSGDNASALISVANQEGSARGVRIVYSNRLNHVWNASAG